MADANTLAIIALRAEQQALAVVERYGTQERSARINSYLASPHPFAGKELARHAALQAELLAGLAEIIEGMITANAEAAKPKRGRPRKETSQDPDMDANVTD